MIIPILLSSNKIVMSLSYGDQTLWPVYITIKNLNTKTWQSQKRPRTLLLGFIFIIYNWSIDANYKNKNLKAKIFPIPLKTILQYTYSCFPFIDYKKMKC